MTVVLDKPEDLTFENICAVAYDSRRLQLSDQARARVVEGRQCFEKLINSGVPCYGVTTGLGKLSTVDLTLGRALNLAPTYCELAPPRPVGR